MARQDKTEICIVLDRSGSMASLKGATIEAFNGFLSSQRRGVGAAAATLVQFDDQYEVVYRGIPIGETVDLDERTYVPRGSTALLDAIGRTILELRRRIGAQVECDRPGAVVFVIQTDGYENASREFTLPQINALIAEMRDRFGWQFVFLGANQDAIASAGAMGIAPQAAIGYRGTASATRAVWGALDSCIHHFRTARAKGNADESLKFKE